MLGWFCFISAEPDFVFEYSTVNDLKSGVPGVDRDSICVAVGRTGNKGEAPAHRQMDRRFRAADILECFTFRRVLSFSVLRRLETITLQKRTKL